MHAVVHAAMPSGLVTVNHDQNLPAMRHAVGGGHQATPQGQLLQPGRWHILSTRRRNDGVERGRRGMPQPAIAKQQASLREAQIGQGGSGALMQGVDALDGRHPAGQQGQHGGLVAAAWLVSTQVPAVPRPEQPA